MNVPCAIYTRKSSEEGLDQNFNSLDAQREACEAYILSQKTQGWRSVKGVYDDGGFSGGNLRRPALQRLLADVADKRIKIIVVYKVDRLTRSLADFAKLVELFDAQGVSFVSVTQQFNTTSSMGRLTLNVLLSFAQFEREVTGERIRDKIAASKRKGLWMGGIAPIGYRPHERTLVIDEPHAEQVREIYRLYLQVGCVSRLKGAVDRLGWITPRRVGKHSHSGGERPFSRGHLLRILSNPIYAGRIPHRDQSYPGTHAAVIDATLWEAVQAQRMANQQGGWTSNGVVAPSLLTGLVFDAAGHRFKPTHSRKGSRRYRYYVSDAAEPIRLPSQELEEAVINAVAGLLGDESRLLETLDDPGADELRNALAHAERFAGVLREAGSGSATPDQLGLVRELLERITIGEDELVVAVRASALGITSTERLTIAVPARVKRCGKTMRLLVQVPGLRPARVPDAKLLNLLGKSQGWFKELVSGSGITPQMIAEREGCEGSYVTRVVYLAFLAPDIVQAIARGEQTADVGSPGTELEFAL